MIKKIRKIASVSEWHGYETNVGRKLSNSLYIAKNSAGKYGLIDDSDSFLLNFDYDAITPMGTGMWQTLQKNKVGLIQIAVNDLQNLYIKTHIPCKYDYMFKESLYSLEFPYFLYFL